jgi:RNA polymerase sigma factor (sigma-70 family)
MYNAGTMLHRSLAMPPAESLRLLDPVELFHLCAADRENTDAWTELLRRYTVKLKHFIFGTLRQVLGHSAFRKDSIASGGIQENDLLQNSIVRLVKNDCAAMKRFSGTSEEELLAYLAVICRSSVLDTLRRNSALKRQSLPTEGEACDLDPAVRRGPMYCSGFEREVLARELLSLTHHMIEAHSGNVSNRDRLVFELHFFDGLSYSQIARCRGINLSKAGVEKLLKRLIDRVQILASTGKSEGMLP